MNLSVVFLVVLLCGLQHITARRVHGKRYDRTGTGNFGNTKNEDRGDEYRELNSRTLEAELVASTEGSLLQISTPGNHDGFNSHIIESTTARGQLLPTTRELSQGNGDEKDIAQSLQQNQYNADYGSGSTSAEQVGYGFKFGSGIPQEIRYTIKKGLPDTPLQVINQEYAISTAEPVQAIEGQSIDGLSPNAEIYYDPAPRINPEIPPGGVNSALVEQNHYPVQYQEVVSLSGSNDLHADQGFSIGSGLRSIAQGSANQAQSAVANQHFAAQQATFVAKNVLAQSAIQSAATAIAALAGKEVLVSSLETQLEEARRDLDHEIRQLENTKTTASTARHAAQQAAYHVSALTAALNNAQQTAEHAETNVKTATAELASQSSMVGDAKTRLDAILGKLRSAKVDYDATRDAAEKAFVAAEQAQQNAFLGGERASHVLRSHAAAIEAGQNTFSLH